MQRQEVVNRVNFVREKQLQNQMRLREIAERKKAKSRASSPNTSNTRATYTAAPYKTIATIQSVNTPTNQVPNIDISRVRGAWFSWYNTTRNALWLWNYNYDPKLDVTAHDWNISFANEKWINHHRRNPGDSYYDFPVIDAWFTARGITPKVINRAKNTENVGYGYYSCSASDCTDELIDSIRSTFDFFMSEKGKSYDAHYRSIVQPYFTKMGFDIIVVPSEKRYYITVHYITNF